MSEKALVTAAIVVVLFSTVLMAGVSLSPMITEVMLPPGQSHEGNITISNTGDVPITVQATVKGFKAPEGVPIFLNPQNDDYPYSGYNLLTLKPTEQTIPAGGRVSFHYTVTMPKELTPYGGRYVAAVFRVIPPTSGAQVVVSAQLASLFLLNPGGGVAPHLRFDSIDIHQSPTNPRKIILKALVTNNGEVHISHDQVWGIIHVTDQDGYIVGSFPVYTHTMLPGTSYTHVETWTAPNSLPSGTYQFNLTVIIFGPLGGEPQRYFLTLPVTLHF